MAVASSPVAGCGRVALCERELGPYPRITPAGGRWSGISGQPAPRRPTHLLDRRRRGVVPRSRSAGDSRHAHPATHVMTRRTFGGDPMHDGDLLLQRSTGLTAPSASRAVSHFVSGSRATPSSSSHMATSPAWNWSGCWRDRRASPLSHSLSQTRPNGAPSSPISTSSITRGLGGFAGKNRYPERGGALPHTREVAGSNPAAPMKDLQISGF
jgi:hypothetical protein